MKECYPQISSIKISKNLAHQQMYYPPLNIISKKVKLKQLFAYKIKKNLNLK